MSVITKKERTKLYYKVRTSLGDGRSDVEIDDDRLDALLEMSIEDISEYMNEWLVEQQWHSLQNIDLTNEDIIFSLTTKTIDWEKSFTYAYSKQVGLGTNAPSEWELKKDYITISAGTQVYEIPAGREVNEVLWYTPTDNELTYSDPTHMGNWSAGYMGWLYGGRPALAMQPTYTLLLQQTDRNMKTKVLGSELTYRITAGPEGKKNLYLYPIPGSKAEIKGINSRFSGSKVWYFYYDNVRDRNKCLELNSDIVKLPSDVPTKELSWDDLNSTFKIKVRKLLTAKAKHYVGSVRGKFSGEIKAEEATLTLDYSFLLSEAREDEQKVLEDLKAYLENISYVNMMENRRSIAENLNTIMGYVPMPTPYIIH